MFRNALCLKGRHSVFRKKKKTKKTHIHTKKPQNNQEGLITLKAALITKLKNGVPKWASRTVMYYKRILSQWRFYIKKAFWFSDLELQGTLCNFLIFRKECFLLTSCISLPTDQYHIDKGLWKRRCFFAQCAGDPLQEYPRI